MLEIDDVFIIKKKYLFFKIAIMLCNWSSLKCSFGVRISHLSL